MQKYKNINIYKYINKHLYFKRVKQRALNNGYSCIGKLAATATCAIVLLIGKVVVDFESSKQAASGAGLMHASAFTSHA